MAIHPPQLRLNGQRSSLHWLLLLRVAHVRCFRAKYWPSADGGVQDGVSGAAQKVRHDASRPANAGWRLPSHDQQLADATFRFPAVCFRSVVVAGPLLSARDDPTVPSHGPPAGTTHSDDATKHVYVIPYANTHCNQSSHSALINFSALAGSKIMTGFVAAPFNQL